MTSAQVFAMLFVEQRRSFYRCLASAGKNVFFCAAAGTGSQRARSAEKARTGGRKASGTGELFMRKAEIIWQVNKKPCTIRGLNTITAASALW